MKKFAVIVISIPFMLAGCSSAPTVSPIIVESSEPSPAASQSTVVVDGDSPSSSATQNPVLGSTVSVGDWQVTVTKVTKNANSAIHHANEFNDKPSGQYVLVEYTAKYVGDDRKKDASYYLEWSFTDSTETVIDPASVVTPADDKDKPTEARKGGTVSLDVVFDINPKKFDGGILSVEDYDSEEYVDFPVTNA